MGKRLAVMPDQTKSQTHQARAEDPLSFSALPVMERSKIAIFCHELYVNKAMAVCLGNRHMCSSRCMTIVIQICCVGAPACRCNN